jgi:acyl-coenzyme A synthetase/AMP-(fatty) acid ligase
MSERVTQLQVTVPVLTSILDQLPLDFRRNDDVRIGLVGSSPSWALVERTQARLSRNIHIELGSTEAGTIASTFIREPEDLRFHDLRADRKVEIVSDNGQRLANGAVGLVKVRLRDNDARGYFESPEETARFFDGDWFLPGDLGRIDSTGRLELLGRVTDVISINGDKHSTLPFEQALERKFSVTGAAVLTAPSKNGEDEVHVVLESEDKTLSNQASALKAMFPSFRNIHVHVIAALPRNHMGKIDRMALRLGLQ